MGRGRVAGRDENPAPLGETVEFGQRELEGLRVLDFREDRVEADVG